MGCVFSRENISEDVYRGLGWLGTDSVETVADTFGADERGRTQLHMAAGQGDEETVCFLLEHGADVNAIDCNGETALQDAIRYGSLEVVELLISAGACLDTFSEDVGAKMCCLAYLGDKEKMEAWKKAGVSFNTFDAQGRTPLHVAVCTNQIEMVKFCVSNGSDPKKRDKLNNSPVDDVEDFLIIK